MFLQKIHCYRNYHHNSTISWPTSSERNYAHTGFNVINSERNGDGIESINSGHQVQKLLCIVLSRKCCAGHSTMVGRWLWSVVFLNKQFYINYCELFKQVDGYDQLFSQKSQSCYSIPQVDGYDQLFSQKSPTRFATKFHLCALKFILVHLMLNSWENKVANGIQPLFTYHDL